jgi:hypothetical protein
MKTILDLFTRDSQALIHYHFPALKDGVQTCWYPSAYQDLRPLHHWKNETNLIYLYTDVIAVNSHFEFRKPNPLFNPGPFRDDSRIEVKWYWKLELNEICWNPNEVILQTKLDRSHEANFYLIHFQLEGRDIPLIYLSFENTNFFFDYLLHDDVRIDKLVHVNDGGMSLGNSNYKMDYIYLYLDELGVNEILVDYTFEEKKEWIISFMRFAHYSPPEMRIPYNYKSRDSYHNRDRYASRNAFYDKFNLGENGRDYEDPGRRRSYRNESDDPRIQKLFTDWIYHPKSRDRPYKHQYIRKLEES